MQLDCTVHWPDCQLAAGPGADCMPAGQLAFPGSEAPVRDPLALSPADGRRSVRPALRQLAERGAGDDVDVDAPSGHELELHS